MQLCQKSNSARSLFRALSFDYPPASPIYSVIPSACCFGMAQQESDSSDDEGEEYTTTTVVLGYASKEATDDSISQLGGFPVR